MKIYAITLLHCVVVSFAVAQDPDTLQDFINDDSQTPGVTTTAKEKQGPCCCCQKRPREKSAKPIIDPYTPATFQIITDQDLLALADNEDRNYTQGTAFVYSSERLYNTHIFWPIRKMGSWLDGSTPEGASTVALGGTAFTPLVLDSINPIIGDRPFSFLLYVSTSSIFRTQRQVSKKDLSKTKYLNIYHTIGINYGVFGTNLGYEFQGWAHGIYPTDRPEDPRGWEHQISAGGVPTLLISYNRFRPFATLPTFGTNNENRSESTRMYRQTRALFDLGGNLGGSAGYYNRLYGGLFGRAGYLKRNSQARWNSGWSTLTGASYQTNESAIEARKGAKKKKTTLEAFVYGKTNATIMIRNSMLRGQLYKESVYVMEPSWTKTWLMEFEWGINFIFEHKKDHEPIPRTWGILFRQVYRSPEFDSRLFPTRWHYFGSLGLIFAVK